ncbi:hypothetical protein MNBD_GAMMA08-2629 [hydrothermal vent metagenome]|uniref:Uncharacterized protein n=1 Tax=hydrothermal vent metagenome TaxID=652676 RepID=A0A3B0X9L2_9ZZZZ
MTPTQSNKLFLLLIVFLMTLTSCAQNESKTPSAAQSNAPRNTSVSTTDRETYKNGVTALYKNNLSQAQRIFNEFIRSQPNLAGGYSNLALIHFKKKEFDKSLKQVNKALSLNPKQAQALNLRAQIYVINGEIHKAKDDYLLAVKYKPNYINAQYNLALLYDIYLQEIKLAIKHYQIYMTLLKKPDEATKEWISHLEGTLKDA